MNIASISRRCQGRSALYPGIAARVVEPRAFTFVEVLVAVTVASAFLLGVYATFIQVLKTQAVANARETANRNGRAALTSMSDEIKQINKLGSAVLFIGINDTLAYGDKLDNDADGRTDEETFDGLDDDGDYVGA